MLTTAWPAQVQVQLHRGPGEQRVLALCLALAIWGMLQWEFYRAWPRNRRSVGPLGRSHQRQHRQELLELLEVLELGARARGYFTMTLMILSIVTLVHTAALRRTAIIMMTMHFLRAMMTPSHLQKPSLCSAALLLQMLQLLVR